MSKFGRESELKFVLMTKFTLILTINDHTTLNLTLTDPQNAYKDIFSTVEG